LIPNSGELASLDLKNGANTIQFDVRSSLQGNQNVKANIYLWDYNAKIIISDVDGTVTKSDIMGHVMPRLGADWSHPGIVDLF
jgi:phosphatidate phosphatase LPIN